MNGNATATYFEEDPCSNPSVRSPIGDLIRARLDRRGALKAAAVAVTGALLSSARLGKALAAEAASNSQPSTLGFRDLAHGFDEHAHVAQGYEIQPLVRWGDAVLPGVPAFNPLHQTAELQSRQFGYNCDYIAFLPLAPGGRDSAGSDHPGSTRGLLCINHEYTDTNLMFPGITSLDQLADLTREQVAIELAAHGHTIVEVERAKSGWRVVPGSPRNRRLTALDTIMHFSGPAAGHDRLKTSQDAAGMTVVGTLNNCAGGVTPWNTVLICEENFNNYFSGRAEATPEARSHKRYGVDGTSRFNPAWAKHFERFNIEKEPREPNRFGWVVEFDPYDPNAVPIKRTALGRLKHEGASIVVNHDGRVVVYSGDDERFEYVYKFVSARRYDPKRREANRDLLDDGTLYTARFDDDGSGTWLPLVYGQGPLTAKNGFFSQADVVIEARRAADLVGATPMDRPEDVEVSPTTGHAFVILTNNSKRQSDQVDAANPRPNNYHGHILELVPAAAPKGGVDHASTDFRWEVFLRAGNPANADDGAEYHPLTSESGWFSSPDNAAFDVQGRLWLTTDSDPLETGFADGVYACDTTGDGRALAKPFFRAPRSAEVTGLCFSPDNETLFVSVQHPGEEDGSNYDRPSTRWPDFESNMPPRPTVVAIVRAGGGKIGS